jgi:hypothetical protein
MSRQMQSLAVAFPRKETEVPLRAVRVQGKNDLDKPLRGMAYSPLTVAAFPAGAESWSTRPRGLSSSPYP